MERILVATDQSANSKSAIRFAVQLAAQRKADLIILQVYHLLKPAEWSDHIFAIHTDNFKKKLTEELSSFIAGIYRGINALNINCQFALVSDIDVVDGIITYASQHNCDYICIGTRGASAIKKIFGTHTAKLISRSPIPVLCIPSAYRLKALKKVLYASDMNDYENELKKVIDFARPIHASVSMVHISYPYELITDKTRTEASLLKKTHYQVSLLTPPRDLFNALLKDIDFVIKKSKPSLLVLFNHQSRPFLEKMFYPSNAENYSFYGKIPLLTFKKGAK